MERKHNRGLIGSGQGLTLQVQPFPNEKKAREIMFVILDSGSQDFPSVNPCGVTAGNTRRVRKIFGNHMLHAACGVVKRHSFEKRVCPKEIAALIQCNWMR